MDDKILQFKNEVLAYKGKYPEKELYKFFKYYTERKPFYKIAKFSIGRRLSTWFSPKRRKDFEKKVKDWSPEDIKLQALKNNLGKFNPLR